MTEKEREGDKERDEARGIDELNARERVKGGTVKKREDRRRMRPKEGG